MESQTVNERKICPYNQQNEEHPNKTQKLAGVVFGKQLEIYIKEQKPSIALAFEEA